MNTETITHHALRDAVTSLLAGADPDTLARVYMAIRTPPPPPPAPADAPSTTLVIDALERASKPLPMREVLRLVRQTVPDCSQGRVSGALNKLRREGSVIRRGAERQGVYSLR